MTANGCVAIVLDVAVVFAAAIAANGFVAIVFDVAAVFAVAIAANDFVAIVFDVAVVFAAVVAVTFAAAAAAVLTFTLHVVTFAAVVVIS